MDRLSVLIAALLALSLGEAGNAEVVEDEIRIAGAMVRYKVVLPDAFDRAETYPGVLVFGGGPQTMRTIDGTLENNFRNEAERRGYIVVAPAAPDDALFFREGAKIFPDFLDAILGQYNIEADRFHVAGPSNGGIAAFHVAALHPRYFRSVTAFPGYMWQPSEAKLQSIANLCVFVYIGENDRYQWHEEMQREVEYLDALGTVARYSLEMGQPHRLLTLAGANAGRLFDGFEVARSSCKR
jgi:predicted peptidase